MNHRAAGGQHHHRHIEEDCEEPQAPIGPGAAVYLFLSIDMANSTAFKGREPRWPFVLHHFYEDVVREIRTVCPRFNVWKYIGDEVTFWRRMEPSDDLIRRSPTPTMPCSASAPSSTASRTSTGSGPGT
jgi:hypothetical protein